MVPLNGERQLLRVEEGSFEVYALIANARHFLGTVTAGGLLIGGVTDGGLLIAASPAGGALSRLASDNLDALGRDPVQRDAVAVMIDQWVALLSDGIARRALDRPRVRALSAGDTSLALEAGEAVAAGKGVVWAVGETHLHPTFLGVAPTEPGQAVPLTSATWLCAGAAGRVSAGDTGALLGLGADAWEDMRRFHGLLLRALAIITAAEEEAEERRLVERDELVERGLQNALARYRRILAPDRAGHEGDSDFGFVYTKLTGRKPARSAAPQASFESFAEDNGGRCRKVRLSGSWWTTDMGPLMARLTGSDEPVALVPDWLGRYRILRRSAPPERVDAALAASIVSPAIGIISSLPNRPLRARDLLLVGVMAVRMDLITLALASAAASLIGLILPPATAEMIDVFIPDQLRGEVAALGVVLGMLQLSSSLLKICSDICHLRLDGRLAAVIHGGVMDRVLRLPSGVLRTFSSADLAMRALSVDTIRRSGSNLVLNIAMTGIFGLSGIFLLLYYDAVAALVVLAIVLALFGIATLVGIRQIKAVLTGETMTANMASFTQAIIENITVIRSFAAERRAFTRWAENSAEMRSRSLKARMIGSIFNVFLESSEILILAAVFVLLRVTQGDALSTGAYIAFIFAFQGFLGAGMAVARAIPQVVALKPLLMRAEPIMKNTPEVPHGAQDPGELSGKLEVSNLRFGYQSDRPVLHGVSFTADPGKFVALVGQSGAGKSTLLGLLLGFERPTGGTVLYDGKDLQRLDLIRMRRQLGIVRQNGQLFAGSLLDNILASRSGGLDEAWEAAEKAGIADEIRALPMQMHTVVTEGSAAFSGGQVQRMLLARALVGRPKLILLDEATSALDNIVQRAITERMENLGCTRLVIAHRLSTVQNADCIHFLAGGRIVESGRYDELIDQDGPFRQFALRQQIN